MSGRHKISFEARFFEKVKKSEGCWEWLAKKNELGYGFMRKKIGDKQKHTRAHRISYELVNGEIPEGMFVLHRCDNPGCVNPDHLFLGNQVSNIRDMHRKGRGANCIGPETAYAILWQAWSGIPRKKIAAEYGVSEYVVKHIAARESWRSLSTTDRN